VSGAGTEPARTQLREAVAALYPRATVVAASDAYAAIATAGHASGVVVIAQRFGERWCHNIASVVDPTNSVVERAHDAIEQRCDRST
jgi:hypothetical protein